jgi:hypothetical protein
MKYISSKFIKKGRYKLILEITDYDIEMFEEFGHYPTAVVNHEVPEKRYFKMENYLKKIFHNIFQRLWREYDE